MHILTRSTYPSLDVQLFLLSLCRWSKGTESSLWGALYPTLF
ncbi:hypothetical protein HMPREF1869_01285 [Bacteroidales bacterium KA00251]|nr:hypothetical protein HMPREF1869_01285 [Bacteroidales bacterium KA00251]